MSSGTAGVPTQEEIAALVYSLWQARGCPVGTPEEDWFNAVSTLTAKPKGSRKLAPDPGSSNFCCVMHQFVHLIFLAEPRKIQVDRPDSGLEGGPINEICRVRS